MKDGYERDRRGNIKAVGSSLHAAFNSQLLDQAADAAMEAMISRLRQVPGTTTGGQNEQGA